MNLWYISMNFFLRNSLQNYIKLIYLFCEFISFDWFGFFCEWKRIDFFLYIFVEK